MKFEQVVHRLSDQFIKSICQTHGKSDQGLTFLLEEAWVKLCWEAMSEDERKVIRFFISEKGKDILTYRELEQSTIPLSSVRFRVALTKLRRSGFIFTLRRMWGEQAFFISDEQLELFNSLCVPVSLDWTSQKHLPESISYHILDDLLQVLNVVRNHSSPISFSKKGTIHKRDMKILFQETKITNKMFSSFAGVNQEEFIIDILMEWGLLKKSNEGNLVLGNMEMWLERSQEDIALELKERFLRDHLPPKLALFFNIVKGLDPTEVYSLQAILCSMGDFAPSEKSVMEKCITPLELMGFIKSSGQLGDMVFQWKQYQLIPDASVYIQPNFEIIMPAFTSLRAKWELMSIANVLRREEMWVLQLSHGSCQTFLESGKSAADVIGVIEQYSRVPIPENVISAVEKWGEEYQRVSFWDVRLFRVSHSKLAHEFEQIPAISHYLHEKVGEGCYIVRVEECEALADELEKRGYRFGPVMNGLTATGKLRDSNILIGEKQPFEMKEQVESIFPALEDAIPEWRQIPRMWVSHYAGYRESTMRQLIQQAIQTGLELKLEFQGQSYHVSPSQLTNKGGSWSLLGKNEDDNKRVEYPIEEIDKIQIVSPF